MKTIKITEESLEVVELRFKPILAIIDDNWVTKREGFLNREKDKGCTHLQVFKMANSAVREQLPVPLLADLPPHQEYQTAAVAWPRYTKCLVETSSTSPSR